MINGIQKFLVLFQIIIIKTTKKLITKIIFRYKDRRIINFLKLILIKLRCGQKLFEDNIVRFDDNYGRIK